jgi:SSS family solute:Na+ symporter
MLVAYVFVFLVPVFYGGSIAISGLTGWPFRAVLWGMVVLVALYTVKGGLQSVMWTDALQCLMLVGGGILLFFVALNKVDGGWAAMVQANSDRFHLYRPMNDPKAPFVGIVSAMCGVILFYQAGNQVMIQRVLGAKSVWDGYIGIIFAGFINFLRPLVTCFLGLIVWHLIHVENAGEPLKKGDEAFSFALRTLAPAWGLRGIVLAGFLAAVMSTLSALANSTATLFALDVYKKLIRREADDTQVVRAGRIASLAALVVAAVVAPAVGRLGGIFTYFQTGVTYLSTPFLSALLLGVLWKRTNYAGGIFAVIGGIVIQAVIAVAFPLAGFKLHWLYLAFFAQILTLSGAIYVSLMTAPPPRAMWEPFQWSPSLLRLGNEGVARPWYKRLMLWYAIYAAIWFYLYWRYW